MKIYVATEGEYSDYHIEAVFLSEKEAELYVAVHQGQVEEYETADGNIKIDKDDCVGYFYETCMCGTQLSQWHYPMLKSRGVLQDLILGIWLPEDNFEKAKKIYQDKLAQLKAKENGLT